MEDGGVRLNKLIAESGLCSRREADRLISEGRVTLRGRAASLGDRAASADAVLVDGAELPSRTGKVYIALHKPVGVVCTCDPRERDNVISYVGHERRLFPVGRLDKDSSGLLILTNDGDVVNRVLRASFGHEKEYVVRADRPVTDEFLGGMRSGVSILGRTTLPCEAERISEREFRLVLTQGLNRQIRRMCEALGYGVAGLHRVRVMGVRLGRLKPGHWRNLTDAEIGGLWE